MRHPPAIVLVLCLRIVPYLFDNHARLLNLGKTCSGIGQLLAQRVERAVDVVHDPAYHIVLYIHIMGFSCKAGRRTGKSAHTVLNNRSDHDNHGTQETPEWTSGNGMTRRGLHIHQKGDQIETLGRNRRDVASQSTEGAWYQVSFAGESPHADARTTPRYTGRPPRPPAWT